jgi:Ca2+-binding RTX toxin-like protein
MTRSVESGSVVSPQPPSIVEQLETRRLLAATLNSNGVLRVDGTSKDDLISIYLVKADPTKLETKVRGVVDRFSLSAITQIIIQGFSGADTIVFDQNNGAIKIPTKIYGGAGNDTISGSATRDRIYGGTGNDSISGESGDDIIYGEEGNDVIQGAAGKDYLDGGVDNDNIQGNAGNDRLFGEDGNDTLSGNAGNDEIYGGAVGDTIFGGTGNDSISGGDDGDFIQGEDGNDIIYGGGGNDFILGGNGDDDLSGGPGSDTLNGLAGNDDHLDDDEKSGEFTDDLGPNSVVDFSWVPTR